MFIHREEYYLRRKEPKPTQDNDENEEESKYGISKQKVNFADRMEQWQKDMDEVLGKAEVIIAKHRNGPVGNVELRFDHNTTAFVDPIKYTEEDFFKEDN